MRDPNIVTSGLSGKHTENGVTVEVQICRLEDEPGWALEVVTEDGSSIVWNKEFETDDAAHAEFLRTVKEEGMSAFEDDSNIIPFRRS